jgi:hypothetical protein
VRDGEVASAQRKGLFRTLLLAASLLAGGASCGTYSRMYPAPKMPGLVETPTGSLRLAQVMALATRDQILSARPTRDSIIASGIQESEIRDGSLAIGRVQCCGGPNEKSNSFVFYVPSGIGVDVGDIVEIKMGRAPNGSDPGILNTVTRVRMKPPTTSEAVDGTRPMRRFG